MRNDFKNPNRGLAIALIAVIAIGLGFFGDFIITCLEKQAYPEGYSEYVTVYAEKYGVPENLVYSVIRTESDFESGAISRVGAVGLMQIIPSTFKWLTNDILFEHLNEGMLFDPETNIRYGTYLLKRLYDRYGDWNEALAAYNAGPGRVDNWLKDAQYTDSSGLLIPEQIPIAETRNYVNKVQNTAQVYTRLYPKLSK